MRTTRARARTSLPHACAARLLVLGLLVGLLSLTMAFHAVSLPGTMHSQSTSEEELTLRLAARGIFVREVDLRASPARIAYDQAIGEAREALALNWILIFRTALEIAPELESMRLEMYYLGDPSLVITAEAGTVLAEDLVQAIAGLQIEDMRPPEEAIRQGMALLGIPHGIVSRTTDATTIHFVVPPDLQPDAILELWIQAFSLAAEKSPDTPRIVLDLALSDGSTSRVEASTSDTLALLDGSLDPIAFAAALVVSGGEPAAGRPSARGSLPSATGLAVGGAYFLVAASLVGGWVLLRVRTTLTRVQQVILLASAAGVLMMGFLIAYLSLFVPPMLP